MAYIIFLLFSLLVLYLVLDFMGPRIIRIHYGHALGFNTMSAADLIVQEFDQWGNLWATRGYTIYRLTLGDNRFIRMTQVPVGLSIYWMNHFRIFRILSGRSECMEMVLSGEKGICAMAAGRMWYSPASHTSFTCTMVLPRYGPGIGRGIMPYGILGTLEGGIWYGEYFNNARRESVQIYAYREQSRNWQPVKTFESGKIRHIHALQQDPWTGYFWFCTGDEDSESMIGYTKDYFATVTIIGQGSQVWRSCHLVFSPGDVYWGTDTGSGLVSGVYKWSRTSGELSKIGVVEGAVFYGTRLREGTIVMTADREGFPNEKDDRTKIILISEAGQTVSIDGYSWKKKKPSIRNGYAMLRIPRKQNGSLLALTVLNQKGISEAELLMVAEEDLKKRFT